MTVSATDAAIGAACGGACSALGFTSGPVVRAVVDERDYAVAFSGAFAAFSQNRTPYAMFFPGGVFDALYPS